MSYFFTKRFLGICFAIIGATFWGLGGTVSDELFRHHGINMNWYVTARLTISGILLLSLYKLMYRRHSLFAIFKNKSTLLALMLFSILGMLLVQYSYMASINYGNAAVATLLQYIAPVYVIIWYVIRKKEVLQLFDIIAIVLTLTGTFLLLTNGSISQIVVAPPSLIWGIISGLSLAFYTIYAPRLLNSFSPILVVGWAMMLSGILMNFQTPIWHFNYESLNFATINYLLFGIFAGTTIAFFFFINSLQYLSAKETTLYGTIEPVVAVVASVLWLKIQFLPFQLVGMLLILILIVILSLKKQPDS
ncbi:DMT family transporter [Staphylococcus arlettae]|uniref:DMT family transporter n=1 Tax=Staphylococcus arlettae TaxID=29378 RepID=UPI0034DD2254